MEVFKVRGTLTPHQKLVSFNAIPESTNKCKIQLYDTSGHVKFIPEFTRRTGLRPATTDSDLWPPMASHRKNDKKTKYLLKVARRIQHRIDNTNSTTTLEDVSVVSKDTSKNTSSFSLDLLQNKPAIIKRRRTVHGVTSTEQKANILEIEIPSVGIPSTGSHTSCTSITSEQTRDKGIGRGRLITVTSSQPCFQDEPRGFESTSEISDSDYTGSVDRLDIQKQGAGAIFPTVDENVSTSCESLRTTLDAYQERAARVTWDKKTARFRSFRKLRYGKSYHNLLQQNVRAANKEQVDAVAARKQKTLRRVRSYGDVNEKYEFRTFRPLYKFRRAVRTVIVLMKATVSSSQTPQRSERQAMSWTQVHDDVGTSRRAYERFGLTFDPSVFRANREAQLSTEAKAILSMDPGDRSEEQLHLALASLKQAVDAFGEFPIKMQRSLVRVGWYEHFERKRVIIRQGHVAENFYFILSGTAVVTILETNKQTREQYGHTVAMLKKGNSFGELALMHGSRRSATVTCKNDVELLAVGRQDFIDIFMNVETNKEPEHITFLRSVDTLRGWPLEVLPYNDPKTCIYTYFRRGVLLCKESNATDWIYVILTGSCRVLKSLYATKPTYEKNDYTEKNKINTDCARFGSVSLPLSSRNTPEECVPRSLAKSRHRRRNEKKTGRRRQAVTCLPVITARSQEDLEKSAEDHVRELDQILKNDSLIDLFNEIPPRKKSSSNSDGQEKVFVQIQKLGPKEIYGLEQAVFSMMGTTTNTSLVSDGAECVLINRKFFLHHLSESTAKRMRRMIQPIPSDDSLQQKLQTKANWEAFKALTVTDYLVYRKHLQDFLNL
ncbi:cyclic nucleotide-binding domain-containing protein 2-like [Haliotis asinina]|uniref:cyclic nucleotide-binding domain-containing protein 2-like n=1 Tax=Haliotis asinina TaxID=109174 RepID=UPI003531CCF0